MSKVAASEGGSSNKPQKSRSRIQQSEIQQHTTFELHFLISNKEQQQAFTMNLNSNLNDSTNSITMSFHQSLEQSQFRVDSPSICSYRNNVMNENPVPIAPSSAPVSPALERLTLNLRLSPWENQAKNDLNSSLSRFSLRDTEGLTPQISIAKVA
jgi:hypothetical protein